MTMLGDLEQQVMEVLWRAPEARSVRDVHTVLTQTRDLAYTTVMTVLDRLAKKGLAKRERDGRQWIYLPAITRQSLVVNQIMELLEGSPDERRAALLELRERLTPGERELLVGVPASAG